MQIKIHITEKDISERETNLSKWKYIFNLSSFQWFCVPVRKKMFKCINTFFSIHTFWFQVSCCNLEPSNWIAFWYNLINLY